jgi:bifunctional UDP-N-acetylglucosamine pyrophosphorylase/glucosamine-1-phosphate N-acetyltransferase
MVFSIGAVVLAAGEGKRLKLDAPKPLAPCLDKKLIDFPLKELKSFFEKNQLDGKITAVVGHQRDLVQTHIAKTHCDVMFAIQEKQQGTADALRAYFNSNQATHHYEYTLVICADTPVVSEVELTAMFTTLQNEKLDAVAASFIEKNPIGYGRVIRAKKGFHIVEEKDANTEEKKISEVNSGLYIMKTAYVLQQLQGVNSNNKSGEFYLTDIFKDGLNVSAQVFADSSTFLGVNTLLQLEQAEEALRKRKVIELREQGVRFIDGRHTYINSDVEIGAGTIIYPQVHISGQTKIGKNAVIEMGVFIKDSLVDDQAHVLAYSVLENAHLHTRAHAGPFARLRPGANIGPDAKIGNFVEIKKSVIGRAAKVSHLSYVGDAFIGDETNIGCGFITCNYDGEKKHITKIGKNCFIGSDSQAVAPVEIGDNCFVASGSTINKNMPEDSFAISRGQQVTKEGMAKKFIKSKKN